MGQSIVNNQILKVTKESCIYKTITIDKQIDNRNTNNKLKQTLTLIYTSIHTERLRTIEMCNLTTLKG